MSDWGLETPFDIDNDELDGLTPQQVFTLGAEWGMLFSDLHNKHIDIGHQAVHAENAERLVRLCRRLGREPLVKPLGEGWVVLRFLTEDNDAE